MWNNNKVATAAGQCIQHFMETYREAQARDQKQTYTHSLEVIYVFHEGIKISARFLPTDMGFDKIFSLFKQIKH